MHSDQTSSNCTHDETLLNSMPVVLTVTNVRYSLALHPCKSLVRGRRRFGKLTLLVSSKSRRRSKWYFLWFSYETQREVQYQFSSLRTLTDRPHTAGNEDSFFPRLEETIRDYTLQLKEGETMIKDKGREAALLIPSCWPASFCQTWSIGLPNLKFSPPSNLLQYLNQCPPKYVPARNQTYNIKTQDRLQPKLEQS